MEACESLEQMLQEHLPEEKLQEARRLLFGLNQGGPVASLPMGEDAQRAAQAGGFDLQAYRFGAAPEQLRPPRVVRVGLVQHAIQAPTTALYAEQLEAIHARVRELAAAAGAAGVQVLCLQEFFHIPYFFATREKAWTEMAQPVGSGPSVALCQELARLHSMVIVCPILERDEEHLGTLWNTAVVISHTGSVIGKHRKNHITRTGDFNESTYYFEGNTGFPVFETAFGRIGVNICYDRHHPLSWQVFAFNGAELVFNPCCTLGAALSEPLWAIEARNAAIAHSFFVGAINRVGTEVFPNAFTSGDGGPPRQELGPFYGSSYLAAPDGSRTPGLSRTLDGLLVADCDLNLCRQARERWSFHMTGRYEMYSELLAQYVKPDFKPHTIRDPSLGLGGAPGC